MTALAKATVETEVVHKEDSAEETKADDGSPETKEVDLTETEAVLKEGSAQERDHTSRARLDLTCSSFWGKILMICIVLLPL